jgi:type I restriction-modification system DNA methylase subunit
MMSNMVDLKEYFQQKYQGRDSFLENIVFPIFGEENFSDLYDQSVFDERPEMKPLADSTGISSVVCVGTILVDFNPINIFDITVSSHVLMNRNRVGIQQLIRRIMPTYSSAFMIFHYEDADNWDWRFTFCSKARNDELTDKKRFTFMLGPKQSCRTVADNFQKLMDKEGEIELQDIEEAFDVEALSDEFFGKYKEFYEQLVQYVTGKRFVKSGGKWKEKKIHEPHEQMYAAFGRNDKYVRDYVKKMMGRIVFLHFLQKKGWMGVPKDKNWGEGDVEFMLHLFEYSSEKQKENFLDEVLEPLFADGLDTDRTAEDDLFDTHVALPEGSKVKVPYLNGGLFERDALDEIATKFPSEYFENLLEFLHQYNFTIDENDPDDAQVGVDPEMLGRIFENLLEDNKDKGAYYTPKEIVRYMCRQSLVAYLVTDIDDEAKKQQVADFVRNYDAELLGGSVSDFAQFIDERLKDVKICDPAIGSGAFPMGLLKELFLCRGAIENFSNAADIKRHIIQKNIYGVDYERGAVDIARLRFWLTLVVDEETPHTLPNLDFKIMQGNSLFEWYEGVDLRGIVGEVGDTITFREKTTNPTFIKKWLDQYFETKNHEERIRLRGKISGAVEGLIESNNPALRDKLFDLDIAANNCFFLWHTWFNDVFKRAEGNGGFDIVIGNPPYGAKLDVVQKKVLKSLYQTTQTLKDKNNKSLTVQKGSMDTYTMFIELAYNIMRINGCMTMIVPISLTSSDSLSGVHNILKSKCDDIYISSYAVRPQPVFKNAMVNTSILAFRKTGKPCSGIYATKMYRKGKNFNLQMLVEHLQFVEVKELMLFGRIPKISLEMEKDILKKLSSCDKLKLYERKLGSDIYYRTSGGRYFKVVTNYSTGSSKEKPIVLDEKYANALGCILSSNLSFWFYQIYSNNLDWKSNEIENTPIPPLSNETIEKLDELYKEYLADIEANANKRLTSGDSTYKVDSYKEYKIGKSKAIIDKIDDLICPLYGLSAEETNFIKNYEIEFRLSGEEE